jgi:Secreted repeat of unknown function
VNDVDTERRIRCIGECARVWIPLTVEKDDTVTSQTPVPIGQVTIERRPDGRMQAALNGKPLYTYSEESETGAAGNGVTDSFGGTEFSWSALSPEDAGPRPGQGATIQPGQGPGGGPPSGQSPSAP